MPRGGGESARRRASPVAVAASLALACSAPAPPAPAEIVYDGATSIGGTVMRDLAPAFRERTGVTLRVERSGSGKGLRAALAGKADLAGVARSLSPAELAERPYFQIVGYDALAVFVHEGNPIPGLSLAQARALFTGEARSWKDVGGPALPVLACTEHLDSGRATVDTFRAMALGGRPYGKVREMEDPADCVAWLVSQPGGVTVATVTLRRTGVRPLPLDGLEPAPENVRTSRYPLIRPLLLVSRRAPQGAVRDLFDQVLSPEGQAVVARNGFVPAR
ncbi:MAG TPA: substrate-binding domain-containing protein [Anaeromyxobacteraceae bacterium]|nr:substrate-binding domain-containing protein [Anaeromyxobacteraceae bacterium]